MKKTEPLTIDELDKRQQERHERDKRVLTFSATGWLLVFVMSAAYDWMGGKSWQALGLACLGLLGFVFILRCIESD